MSFWDKLWDLMGMFTVNEMMRKAQYKLNLNKDLLDSIKSKLINEITQPELGKRTTSHSISGSAEISNGRKNVGK
jgi:hypothetical protein